MGRFRTFVAGFFNFFDNADNWCRSHMAPTIDEWPVHSFLTNEQLDKANWAGMSRRLLNLPANEFEKEFGDITEYVEALEV